jgi:hypothetical protein
MPDVAFWTDLTTTYGLMGWFVVVWVVLVTGHCLAWLAGWVK